MRKTLILFIDAFSFTDLNEENTPFINKLAKEGAGGPVTTVPAGYHIEYSMLSGALPLKHNVWTWYYMNDKGSFSSIKYIKPLIRVVDIFSKKLSRTMIDVYVNLIRLFQGKTRFLKTNKIPIDLLEKFEISADKSYIDHNPMPIPTLFDVLRGNGVQYTAMEFPTISNNRKTGIYFEGEDFRQIRKAEKFLRKDQVVFLHIWGLDKIEHEYGLHSDEAISYLKKVDHRLQEIYEEYGEDLNIIIFSDHGGCNVTKTKNIKEILDQYEGDFFIGSTTAQVWLKDINQKSELETILKDKGYLVYNESNVEKELLIPYKREFVGDILVYVKPGEQLYPDYFRDTDRVKSMHGYSERVPELEGVFVINGFETGGRKIQGMNLYDIAPTILKAMGMPLPESWDGEPK
jgi:Type I phosphodiesterase / nucleotide pyrophosphatase